MASTRTLPSMPPNLRLVSQVLTQPHHSAPLRVFDRMVLGRTRGDVLFPEDPLLAEAHLRFSLDARLGLFLCEDLGSENGTCLNRLRLRPFARHLITPGDRLEIGNQCFQLQECGLIRK